MAVTVVVGAQWGDEAKGKIVDFLASDADYVARYGGGNNAGHTVWLKDQEFKFHTVPCGLLHPHATAVIGDGVAVDPINLAQELDIVAAKGIDSSNLRIGSRCHLILRYHTMIDELEESRRGSSPLGTTKRGIGPTYADKAARSGLRMEDLVDPLRFRARLEKSLEQKNAILKHLYGHAPIALESMLDIYEPLGRRFRDQTIDVPARLLDAVRSGKRIIMEGAQGTLLDIDYGAYPFVTSSHPIAAGACLGTGIGPRHLKRIIGVAKAYTTRVGEGPFATELKDSTGERIRDQGQEYGTTTGRPRRCGWLDLPMLKYSAEINTMTELAITRLDVLSGIDPLKACIEHGSNGPVYIELEGWKDDLRGIRSREALPDAAQRYLSIIEERTGVPVSIVSVGPERSETIVS